MIFPIISQTFSSNSYLLLSEKAAVVDPGIYPPALIEEIEKQKITLDYIILTHCHYDHLASIPQFKKKFPAKILIHQLDASALERGDDKFIHGKVFNSSTVKIKVDTKLKEGDKINLGQEMELEVFSTPGHSPGSICLYEQKEKALFSGDTIFTNGVGRTDLDGGSWDELKKSFQKILKLKKERGIEKVYSGHGPTFPGENIEKIYEHYFE